MKKTVSIGVVGFSGKVPKVEFQLGLDMIRSAGFKTIVHPQCSKSHRYFSGTDEDRARAFVDWAYDDRFDIIWSARGGYGAARTLPIIDALTRKKKAPPKKLLMGYSDATAMIEYVRSRWGWATLHSPMPGMRKFCLQTDREWESLDGFVRGEKDRVAAPWDGQKLKFVGKKPSKAIQGELVGGNLAVWVSLLGTPYAPKSCRGKIVFLEDVDESLYRVDRMVQQLVQAGALDGARAILLGNFLNCNDAVSKVLARKPAEGPGMEEMLLNPKPEDLEPIRPKMETRRELLGIFEDASRKVGGVPVGYELPVGHGPGIAALPLGARYRISSQGQLELLSWEWTGSKF